MADVVVLRGIRKSYSVRTPAKTEVLHGIDLSLKSGDFVALMGPSGSGKSTLLNIIVFWIGRPRVDSLLMVRIPDRSMMPHSRDCVEEQSDLFFSIII